MHMSFWLLGPCAAGGSDAQCRVGFGVTESVLFIGVETKSSALSEADESKTATAEDARRRCCSIAYIV